jgi:hypothetical protein
MAKGSTKATAGTKKPPKGKPTQKPSKDRC